MTFLLLFKLYGRFFFLNLLFFLFIFCYKHFSSRLLVYLDLCSKFLSCFHFCFLVGLLVLILLCIWFRVDIFLFPYVFHCLVFFFSTFRCFLFWAIYFLQLHFFLSFFFNVDNWFVFLPYFHCIIFDMLLIFYKNWILLSYLPHFNLFLRIFFYLIFLLCLFDIFRLWFWKFKQGLCFIF